MEAVFMDPCLWTLNMPSIAINKIPVAIAKNCEPTPEQRDKQNINRYLVPRGSLYH